MSRWSPGPPPGRPGRGAGLHRDAPHGRPLVGERFVAGFLFACGALSIFTTLGILGVLGYETAAFFSEVSVVDFLGDTEWTPLFAEKRFGIWALVSGTVLTSLIAMAVALPFGLLSAIYLSELAPDRARRVLKPLMELAGRRAHHRLRLLRADRRHALVAGGRFPVWPASMRSARASSWG
jgi:hypothetical protein